MSTAAGVAGGVALGNLLGGLFGGHQGGGGLFGGGFGGAGFPGGGSETINNFYETAPNDPTASSSRAPPTTQGISTIPRSTIRQAAASTTSESSRDRLQLRPPRSAPRRPQIAMAFQRGAGNAPVPLSGFVSSQP